MYLRRLDTHAACLGKANLDGLTDYDKSHKMKDN